MTWLLIGCGAVVGLMALFAYALCAAAADADRLGERALDRDADGNLLIVDELHRHSKRPGDVGASRGMTEDR